MKQKRVRSKAERFFSWSLVNFSVLAGLILSEIYSLSVLNFISLGLLWFTAIVGILLMNDWTVNAILDREEDYTFRVPRIIDIVYDLSVVGVLVYFDYITLGFFYLIHIFTTYELRTRVLAEQARRANLSEKNDKEQNKTTINFKEEI